MARCLIPLIAAAVLIPVACSRGPRASDGEKAARAPARPYDPSDETAVALKARIESGSPPPVLQRDSDARGMWDLTRRFYADNGFQPAWFEHGRPRRQIAVFREALARAEVEGLRPADYALGDLKALEDSKGWGPFKKTIDRAKMADLDVRLTAAFMRYGTHLVRGRLRPGQVDKHWFGRQRTDDVPRVLRAAVETGEVDKAFSALTPQHPQYVALRGALARYREMEERGGWPAVAHAAAGPGSPHAPAAAVRARLVAMGDLAPEAVAPSGSEPAAIDALTGQALERFQKRHGLTPTGRLDGPTRAALDVPLADRIRQIEHNLERWRWLPERLGDDRYVIVNIPTFHLTAYEGGRPTLEMRVVTGKQESPTPIFSDEMTTVVFSPYWNVPPDIARDETIPAAMNDPGYIERNGMEVVRGSRVVDPWRVDWSDPNLQIRQRPGPSNALGHVKFMFPNQFDVYLHDTPADALFGRVERDYSHGCVRVEKPFELAQWVLRGQPEWTAERIQAAMLSGHEQHVALKSHIPVYIVYQTAWVDDDGAVQFRDDIYGHDQRQWQLLPQVTPTRIAKGATRASAG